MIRISVSNKALSWSQSFRISYSGMMGGKEVKDLMSREFGSLGECLENFRACVEKAKGEAGTKTIRLLNNADTVLEAKL